MREPFEIGPQGLQPLQSGPATVTVYLNPDPAERESLQQHAGLDAHSLSSALDADEVPRLEIKPDQLFVIWKRPENYSFDEGIHFNVSSVGMILLRDQLVVTLTAPLQLRDDKSPLRIQEPMDVLLGVLYQTTRHFLEHLKVIHQISREIQQKINTALENTHLLQMFNLGESLTYYLNAISGNAIVLSKLRNHTTRLGLSQDQTDFLEDIIIENQQCARQAEIYTSVLSGLMDARGTLVNNNMNVILKNLTIINTVFLPLNLIASIGGMSEYSMMTQGWDWRLSYGLFGLMMVGVGWFTVGLINRYSWWQQRQSGFFLRRRLRREARRAAPPAA